MSDLTWIEKTKFERLLRMSTGYVADFSNHTFQTFVAACVGIDFMFEKYASGSGSKANRLRALWSVEENYLTGK